MFQLNNLTSLTKKRKRIGRGGSRGGTSGRGHKGQRARSGGVSQLKGFFEGGQMPLSRRLPRRGFTNPFKVEWKIININDLDAKFSDNEVVSPDSLREKGFFKGKKKSVIKILGNGQITRPLTVQAHAFTKSAVIAIEKSGGNIEIIKESERGNPAT